MDGKVTTTGKKVTLKSSGREDLKGKQKREKRENEKRHTDQLSASPSTFQTCMYR
jgi:hypothetical protein